MRTEKPKPLTPKQAALKILARERAGNLDDVFDLIDALLMLCRALAGVPERETR